MPKKKVESSAESTATVPEPVGGKRDLNQLEESDVPAEILSEPSLAERLEQDGLYRETDALDKLPKTDSLAILLEQGLTSNDESILRSVLMRSDDRLIRKTVEQLPAKFTVPLINYLGKMVAEEKPLQNRAPLLWLSITLTVRASYLTTLPNLPDVLRDIRLHCDRRTKNLPRFIHLAGVISTSINLVKQRQFRDHENATEGEALKISLTYAEESTSSEDEEENMDEDSSGTGSHQEDSDVSGDESDNDEEHADADTMTSDEEVPKPKRLPNGKRKGDSDEDMSE